MERLSTTPKSDRLRWANHAPGHVREMFVEAMKSYYRWKDGGPEPTVTYEINYEPHEITISEACGILWNCKDILPGEDFQMLKDCGVEPKRQTYAAAAHAMLEAIKERSNAIR